MSCFWPKHNIFELKTYRGVIFDSTEHRFEEKKEFEEKMTCTFKNDTGNLANFYQSTFENLDFYWVLLSKVENVWAQTLQEIYVSWK